MPGGRARTLALFIAGPVGPGRNLGWSIAQVRAAAVAFLQWKRFPQGKGALRSLGGYFNKRLKEVMEQGISKQMEAALHAFEEIDAALAMQAVERLGWRPKRRSFVHEAAARRLALRISQDVPGVRVQGVRPVNCAQGAVYVVDTLIGPLPYSFASSEEMLDYDRKRDTRASGGK